MLRNWKLKWLGEVILNLFLWAWLAILYWQGWWLFILVCFAATELFLWYLNRKDQP